MHTCISSVVEENLGPLSKWIFSLVEVSSLVKTAGPLKQLLVFGCSLFLCFVWSKISIGESLFPCLLILRCVWIEEAAVRSLELTLAEENSSLLQSSSQTRGHLFSVLGLRRGEAEGINSVGRSEESSIGWVLLNVLPSRVRPSARDKLQVLLWDSNSVCVCSGGKDIAARTHRSTSGLVAATVVEHVVPLAVSSVLHCCLQIYKLY